VSKEQNRNLQINSSDLDVIVSSKQKQSLFSDFSEKKNLIQRPRRMPSKTLPIFGFNIIH
jgi:hypothetical protein